jgi:hypothetical protein
MSHVTKSVRDFLLGSVSDFTDACAIPHLVTNSNLTSLIVSLANYQEEGARLLPEVYLCADLSSMLKIVTDYDSLPIGSETNSVDALSSALKKCAPLARHGWHIYVEASVNKFTYGLFRGSMNPVAITVDRSLFTGNDINSTKYVSLCQIAAGCIEIKSSNGSSRTIILNDKPDSLPSPNINLKKIVDAICSKVNVSYKDTSTNFVRKTLQTALNDCHGTIIAVANGATVPKFLSDGISLGNPIDFPFLIKKYQIDEKFKIDHQHTLVANSALLKGMISSDGITVFDAKARILAYNCFIASSSKSNGKPPNGGARTRAYEALCNKIGHGLLAVYVQSQDGWTKFQGVN